MLLLDGVYVEEGGRQAFKALELGSGDVAWLVLRVRRRILRRVARRGLLPDSETEVGGGDDAADELLLARLQGAAMQGRIALGPRAGWRVERVGAEEVRMAPLGILCAEADGFNVHAGVRVIAGRRTRLKALCRYLLRPPLCEERLSQAVDGRVVVRLKRSWPEGTRALRFEPLDFLSKLAAPVPPPRRHLVVYAGVLSAHASDRSRVVPAGRADPDGCDCSTERAQRAPDPVVADEISMGTALPESPQRRGQRLLWAELLRRTFGLDVLQCMCGGRMRLLCCVTDPDALIAIARSLGRTTPLPRPPPRQLEWFAEMT